MAANLPPDLRPQFADPETPWQLSNALFEEVLNAPAGPYKKCVVTQKHIEWDFVHRFFNANRPTNLVIKAIYCIHNSNLTELFNKGVRQMAEQAKNTAAFGPKWELEKSSQRQEVMDRWKKISSSYTPFKAPLDNERKEECSNVYVLPLWHGSNPAKCDSISKTGFAYFGQGATNTTDAGFFARGIYFTNSCKYATDIYAAGIDGKAGINAKEGHLLLSWVSMREPYPLIGHKKFPAQPPDMDTFLGKNKKAGYNAHFIPVKSTNPNKIWWSEYHPYPPGDNPVWDEFVVFESAQTLPRFWIELELNQPSVVPAFHYIQEFQTFINNLLKNSDIQNTPDLQLLLKNKVVFLGKFYSGSERLTSREEEYFDVAKSLLDNVQKVNQAAAKKIFELEVVFSFNLAPKKIQKTINVKANHPHYISRNTFHKELEQLLVNKKSYQHVLFGPGGSGKTELAIAFANLHRQSFASVCLISCGTDNERMLGYRDLASVLKINIDAKDGDDEIVRKVHFQLEQTQGKPWLIIFDNLNTAHPLPPSPLKELSVSLLLTPKEILSRERPFGLFPKKKV